MQRANQRVPQIDRGRQVGSRGRLTRLENWQLAAPGFPSPPPVGGQVVQCPPQTSLWVARDPPSLLDQPLKRGLQQVLAVLPATGQQHRCSHQLGAALGQQQLEGIGVLSFLHAITSFFRLPSTKEVVA